MPTERLRLSGISTGGLSESGRRSLDNHTGRTGAFLIGAKIAALGQGLKGVQFSVQRVSANGTPIDLTRIETPAYIQAGREDHIAPAESVWRLTRHLRGPWTFLLAGSGHIAGVVNPPSAKKYQYWTNPGGAESYADFVDGAQETPGSWWPHWIDWLRSQDSAQVPAKGKRVPGAKGDTVIEDAPGRYVKTR